MKEIDKEGIKIKVNGTDYYKFGVEYIMPDGTEWGFDIWAKDWKEADERIKMIKLTARNNGQTVEIFDAD